MTVAAIAIAALLACTGATSERVVTERIDAVRHLQSTDAGRALVTLLPEQSPIYQGRGPNEAARLRRSIFVALSESDPPTEALPFVISELQYGHRADLLAAAARTAGAFGPQAGAAVSALLRILSPAFHDDQVCLTSYDSEPLCAKPTTARLEAVGALSQIGAAARDALPVLRTLAEAEPAGPSPTEVTLRREAKRAMSVIDGPAALPEMSHDFASPWLPRNERRASLLMDIRFVVHDGRQSRFSELAGAPLALTFAYTRCDNPNKCPVTIASMARLQRSLRTAGVEGKVRIAVITLDPDYDDTARLGAFASIHGLQLTDRALMLRTDAADLARLERTMDVPVGRGAGQINGHGVVLYLFDRRGRFVRQYNGASEEKKIVADLRRLAAERP